MDTFAPLIARAVKGARGFAHASDDALAREVLSAAIAVEHALAGRDVLLCVPDARDVHAMLRAVLTECDIADEPSSADTAPDSAAVRVAGRSVYIRTADHETPGLADAALVIYDAHRITRDGFAGVYHGARMAVIGARPRPHWFATLLAQYEEAVP